MEINDLHWMKRSIEIAQKGRDNLLRVGAILVSETNEELCHSFSGEEKNASWCECLIKKIREKRIHCVHRAYLTINTVSKGKRFDVNELLKEIIVKSICVGLPDPIISSYENDDPIMQHNCVNRFTDELQREIIIQNISFFESSEQNIRNNPYYSENRISNLILTDLRSKGIIVTKKEIENNKKESALVELICKKYEISHEKAEIIVSKALSKAFDQKYSSYNYLHDARSIDFAWKENFKKFYKKTTIKSMKSSTVLNIGVGSGNEAISLFSKCDKLTFVDIAQGGINKLKDVFPSANTYISSADDLKQLPDNHFDLYISLRTYNSSFFNIKHALNEAKRVLKPKAVMLISIANGFLCSGRNAIIPGLIISGTEFVDLYRSMDTIRLIKQELREKNFIDIRVYPTNTEIYLSAIINE